MSPAPIPENIKLSKSARELQLTYAGGESYKLAYEFLRVLSPSAEVRGHGGQGAKLEVGKRDINVLNITPAGNYALKISFSDGHDTGLYSWDYLWDLCQNQDQYWQGYLEQLKEKGASRDAPFIEIKSVD